MQGRKQSILPKLIILNLCKCAEIEQGDAMKDDWVLITIESPLLYLGHSLKLNDAGLFEGLKEFVSLHVCGCCGIKTITLIGCLSELKHLDLNQCYQFKVTDLFKVCERVRGLLHIYCCKRSQTFQFACSVNV